MRRLEAYVIGAADALLCPSHYLERQCDAHYGLVPGSVTVIPHPVGDTAAVERPPATWERGGVCYLGRLEPRKGVIEWVDAAVSIAPDCPGIVFDFVGADMPFAASTTVQEIVTRRIPEELRPRFRFHGSQPRA